MCKAQTYVTLVDGKRCHIPQDQDLQGNESGTTEYFSKENLPCAIETVRVNQVSQS